MDWVEYEKRKQEALQQVRENSTDMVTIHSVSDPDYITELVHSLYTNESVNSISFEESRCIEYSDDDAQQQPMTTGEWQQLIGVFQTLGSRIIQLQVSGSSIPTFVVPTLLWQFRNLRELSLQGAHTLRSWNRRQWTALSAALTGHPALEIVSVEAWGFIRSDLAPNDSLALTLATNVPNLREYTHSGNRLTELEELEPMKLDDDVEMDDATFDIQPLQLNSSSLIALIKSKSLKVLNYVNTGLNKEADWPSVSLALEFSTLKELSFRNSFVRDDDAVLIAKGLEGNNVLEKLDLSHSNIGDYGGSQAIVSMLGVNQTLTYLDLSNCFLSSNSFVAMASMLQVNNSSLTYLNLGSPIEPDCSPHIGPAFMDALKTNTTLKFLFVRANPHYYITFGPDWVANWQADSRFYPYGPDPSTMSLFYLRLNFVGRGKLLGPQAASREEWVDALIAGSHDMSILFFLLQNAPLSLWEM